ncbi:Uncharacterised protein [Serratia quinivorans]|nr:Uncharacterised protein [Serratia quinivorans]
MFLVYPIMDLQSIPRQFQIEKANLIYFIFMNDSTKVPKHNPTI